MNQIVMKAIQTAIYSIVFLFAAFTANAQSDYSIQTRELKGTFNTIRTDGKVEVQIVMDNGNKVEVAAPAKIIDKVETKVENGIFTVYLKKGLTRHDVKITLHCSSDIVVLDANGDSEIEARALAGKDLTLKAATGSDIDIKRIEATGKLTIDAQSGADIEIDYLTASEIVVNANSGADVDIKGSAKRANLNASAGAEIDVEDMKFENINASATAGARISR